MAMTPQNALVFLPPAEGHDRMLIHSAATPASKPVPTTLHPLDYVALSCFSPDGTTLYALCSTSDSYNQYVLHAIDTVGWTKALTSTFAHPMNGPVAMVATPDGFVVVAAQSGVHVLSAADGQQVTTTAYAGPPPPSNCGARMTLTPDGGRVLIGLVALGLMVINTNDWSLGDPRSIDQTFGIPDETHPEVAPASFLAQFSPDGSRLYYTAGIELKCLSWPSLAPIQLPAETPQAEFLRLMFLDAAGTEFLYQIPSGADVGNVVRVDVSTGVATTVFTMPAAAAGLLQWVDADLSPDGSKLAVFWCGTHEGLNGGFSAYFALEFDLDAAQQGVIMFQPYNVALPGSRNSGLCVWTPGATLTVVAGKVTDENGAPVARTVLVHGRDPELGLPPAWGVSDAVTGRYAIPIAAGGVTVSRIVFDSTGNFNDLIDKVVL